MKQFYLFCMALLACTAAFAQTTISTSNTNGTWDIATFWTINGSPAHRVPANGDIIEIEEGATMYVYSDVALNNIHLRVRGRLVLVGHINMTLNSGSDIALFDGATLERVNTTPNITISNSTVFGGSIKILYGPSTFSVASMTAGVTILPVKFLGFSLTRQHNDVLVQWSTAEERNSHSFEVERSTDGATWIRVATLPAKGSSGTVANYSFTDRQVTAAVAYYRVRQVDTDGKYTYTAIKTLKNGAGTTEVNVAAINHRVVLQFSAQVRDAVVVRLVSLSGQVVSRQVIDQPVGQIILNTPMVRGGYIVTVSNARDIDLAKQIIL